MRPRFLPKPSRLLRVALLVGLIGAAFGGVANAYWLGSGGGSGSGTSAATVAVTLSPGSASGTLYPGGQADVVLTVSNANSPPVHVGALALATSLGSGGFSVDAGHSGCAVTALSFTTQTNSGAGWTVPAKSGAVNGALPITLTSAVSMDVGAANACQGASFTVYLAAGA